MNMYARVIMVILELRDDLDRKFLENHSPNHQKITNILVHCKECQDKWHFYLFTVNNKFMNVLSYMINIQKYS